MFVYSVGSIQYYFYFAIVLIRKVGYETHCSVEVQVFSPCLFLDPIKDNFLKLIYTKMCLFESTPFIESASVLTELGGE